MRQLGLVRGRAPNEIVPPRSILITRPHHVQGESPDAWTLITLMAQASSLFILCSSSGLYIWSFNRCLYLLLSSTRDSLPPLRKISGEALRGVNPEAKTSHYRISKMDIYSRKKGKLEVQLIISR